MVMSDSWKWSCQFMRVLMSIHESAHVNSWECSCQIHESGCLLRKRSQSELMSNSWEWLLALQALAKRAHAKFMRVLMSNSWECLLASQALAKWAHVKFMRVTMSNSWECSCQIHRSYYKFFIKLKL